MCFKVLGSCTISREELAKAHGPMLSKLVFSTWRDSKPEL